MASSNQLAIGQKMSLPLLGGSWLKNNKARGFDVKVSQNAKSPKARCFCVCDKAPKAKKEWETMMREGSCCKAHVHAIGPNREDMEVVSVDHDHTCKPDDPGGRKRNCRTKDILDVSDVLSACEPTKSKEGNAKQFAGMTEAATGFDMKVGQARSAIRNKTHDTLEAQIGQCMLMPSVLEAHQDSDPGGTYKLQDQMCSWDVNKRQFRRCCVCMSIAKHFWNEASIETFVCDGTFTRLRSFKHIILLAVTFDGNNQVIILAFAVVDIEDSFNWTWFKECPEDDFPGCLAWMSDADKGITSERFEQSMSQNYDSSFEKSRCIRHLSENCKENNPGKMNEDHKLLTVRLAKARTEEVHQQRLQAIRDCRSEWADWLDERKHEFAAVSFLDKGISRFGKVTSNAVENTNSAIVPERSLPIMHMIEGLTEHQREKHSERQALGKQWSNEGKVLTLYCEGQDASLGETAGGRAVTALQSNHPIYKAHVSVGANSGWTGESVEVMVNVETHEQKCPCQNCDGLGAPCHHVKALLLKIGCSDHNFCHKRCHSSTCGESYSADIPDMSLVGKLKGDLSLCPPDCEQPAGRPPTKRKARDWLLKTGKRRKCKACGREGHFGKKCTKPNTQCRVEQNSAKAEEYCRRIEGTGAED